MSLVVDEHREYLADSVRVAAFDAALRALVRPGDVVLDLASGTGILGLLACRAGARRVYAIEMGSIAELARDIARANGFGDRFVAIQEVSTRATLPERVDLIVMDGAGRFGFDGGVVETLSDARRRLGVGRGVGGAGRPRAPPLPEDRRPDYPGRDHTLNCTLRRCRAVGADRLLGAAGSWPLVRTSLDDRAQHRLSATHRGARAGRRTCRHHPLRSEPADGPVHRARVVPDRARHCCPRH